MSAPPSSPRIQITFEKEHGTDRFMQSWVTNESLTLSKDKLIHSIVKVDEDEDEEIPTYSPLMDSFVYDDVVNMRGVFRGLGPGDLVDVKEGSEVSRCVVYGVEGYFGTADARNTQGKIQHKGERRLHLRRIFASSGGGVGSSIVLVVPVTPREDLHILKIDNAFRRIPPSAIKFTVPAISDHDPNSMSIEWLPEDEFGADYAFHVPRDPNFSLDVVREHRAFLRALDGKQQKLSSTDRDYREQFTSVPTKRWVTWLYYDHPQKYQRLLFWCDFLDATHTRAKEEEEEVVVCMDLRSEVVRQTPLSNHEYDFLSGQVNVAELNKRNFLSKIADVTYGRMLAALPSTALSKDAQSTASIFTAMNKGEPSFWWAVVHDDEVANEYFKLLRDRSEVRFGAVGAGFFDVDFTTKQKTSWMTRPVLLFPVKLKLESLRDSWYLVAVHVWYRRVVFYDSLPWSHLAWMRAYSDTKLSIRFQEAKRHCLKRVIDRLSTLGFDPLGWTVVIEETVAAPFTNERESFTLMCLFARMIYRLYERVLDCRDYDEVFRLVSEATYFVPDEGCVKTETKFSKTRNPLEQTDPEQLSWIRDQMLLDMFRGKIYPFWHPIDAQTDTSEHTIDVVLAFPTLLPHDYLVVRSAYSKRDQKLKTFEPTRRFFTDDEQNNELEKNFPHVYGKVRYGFHYELSSMMLDVKVRRREDGAVEVTADGTTILSFTLDADEIATVEDNVLERVVGEIVGSVQDVLVGTDAIDFSEGDWDDVP